MHSLYVRPLFRISLDDGVAESFPYLMALQKVAIYCVIVLSSCLKYYMQTSLLENHNALYMATSA
jgi:hypothetical protein